MRHADRCVQFTRPPAWRDMDVPERVAALNAALDALPDGKMLVYFVGPHLGVSQGMGPVACRVALQPGVTPVCWRVGPITTSDFVYALQVSHRADRGRPVRPTGRRAGSSDAPARLASDSAGQHLDRLLGAVEGQAPLHAMLRALWQGPVSGSDLGAVVARMLGRAQPFTLSYMPNLLRRNVRTISAHGFEVVAKRGTGYRLVFKGAPQ